MSCGINHRIETGRVAVLSLEAMEKPNLTDADYQKMFDRHRLVAQWAWEHLCDPDRDAFFVALHQERYVDAHAILTAAAPWPWRRRQWDAWLADRTA